MKQFLKILVIALVTSTSLLAQPQRRFERIHSLKVAYITDRIQLTSEQSAAFWPVYNEYEREMQSTRKQFANQNHDNRPMSDEASMHLIDDNLDYQQRVLDIKKKYKDQFLKILSPQQLVDLYKAERQFKLMLIQQLKQKHGNNGGRWRNHNRGYDGPQINNKEDN